MSEKKWFTKTTARETVTEKVKELLASEDINEKAAEELNALFAGKQRTSTSTLVKNDDGDIVGKRCSVFGVYMPISEFGTTGTNEDGTPKYAYQSKEGAKAVRDRKKAYEEALKAADNALEETEDVEAWKEAKALAKEEYEAPYVYDGETEVFDTAEDLLASL